MIENYNLDDIVQMKKDHPCHKSHFWKIVRVGVDIKIKCEGCGAVIMMERREFERKCKKLISKASDVITKEEVKEYKKIIPNLLGVWNGVEIYDDVPRLENQEINWLNLGHGIACPRCNKMSRQAALIEGKTYYKHNNHYWVIK